MSKLIVFDFDGTLVDTWAFFEKLARDYTEEKNLSALCVDSLRVGYGYPEDHDFWADMAKDEQLIHLKTLFQLSDDYHRLGKLDPIPNVFDGVSDVLEELKTLGYTLAIATAKPYEPLYHLVDHHKMDHFFCSYRSYDDVKNRGERLKPYPDQLISLMNELGHEPDRTVMIGDTCMDIRMANAAKVKSIGVTWGNHCEDRLSKAGATHIVTDHFSDIIPILKAV